MHFSVFIFYLGLYFQSPRGSFFLTFLQWADQTATVLPVTIPTPRASPGITHPGGAGPAMFRSHWEGEDSDPRPAQSPGLGTPLGHSRGAPRGPGEAGKTASLPGEQGRQLSLLQACFSSVTFHSALATGSLHSLARDFHTHREKEA